MHKLSFPRKRLVIIGLAVLAAVLLIVAPFVANRYLLGVMISLLITALLGQSCRDVFAWM